APRSDGWNRPKSPVRRSLPCSISRRAGACATERLMTVMTTGRGGAMTAPAIDFGTSGLRGRAEGFTPEAVFAHVGGFLETACGQARAGTVLIGRDLRESSPAIAALVAGAVEALGWRAVNAGMVPTPGLALDALKRGVPAIMVTGSHIPSDY